MGGLETTASLVGEVLGNKTSRGFVNLDCAAGGELLSWNDATLWVFFLLYLFVGIYVICDYYFVPSLEVIGDRLQWSESIQGATLMAAGSSFPEFLTALFGVLFFTDENPGPATNIGSAVFNICIIISFSILFLPKQTPDTSAGYHLHPVAFSRDCFFFIIAAIESYVFFEFSSPGELEWIETLTMTLTYAAYIAAVFFTDRYIEFAAIDTKPPPTPHPVADLEGVELTPIRGTPRRSVAVGGPAYDTIRPTNDAAPNFEDDLSSIDSTDETHQHHHEGLHNAASRPMPIHGEAISKKALVKRCLTKVLHVLEWPYKILFRYTIPSVRIALPPPAVTDADNNPDLASEEIKSSDNHDESEGPPRQIGCTVATFLISMAWLGVITYFTVDIAEDVSACMGFGPSVTGLTVLAVGTSLPDCLSSIIVARRGRINMSVSNALGSNVFDLAFCVGFPFFLKSLISGSAVDVGTSEDFLFLVLAVLMLAVVLVGVLLIGKMQTQKFQSVGLLSYYVVFLVLYCVLFGEDQD